MPHSPRKGALGIAGVVTAVVVGWTAVGALVNVAGADAGAPGGGGGGALVAAAVDVVPSELNCRLSQYRSAKARTAIKRMIAAILAGIAQACRDPAAGDSADGVGVDV